MATKAYQHIQTLVTPIIMDQLPSRVGNAFDLSTAVGTQLDVLGKYAGVTRTGNGPNGPITLADSDFRALIQLAIVDNANNGTLSSIQALLHTYFPGEIFLFDNQDMQISYFVNSTGISLDLAVLFVTGSLLPKTLGVQLASVIYSPSVSIFFGMADYTAPAPSYLTVPTVTPLNTYQSYSMNRPFLDYRDALSLQ